MTNKNNSLAVSGQRQGAFWFALLSIAWMQVSLAAHQFDHVTDYVDGSCQICIQLDRVDDVATDPSAAAVTPAILDSLSSVPSAALPGPIDVRGFDARAPPIL